MNILSTDARLPKDRIASKPLAGTRRTRTSLVRSFLELLAASAVIVSLGIPATAAPQNPFSVTPGPNPEAVIQERAKNVLTARPGLDQYLDGIIALDQLKYAEAADAFSKAIDRNDEDAEFYQARGTALALQDKLPQAAKDITRSLQLDSRNRVSQAWMAALGIAINGNQIGRQAPYELNQGVVLDRQLHVWAWSHVRGGGVPASAGKGNALSTLARLDAATLLGQASLMPALAAKALDLHKAGKDSDAIAFLGLSETQYHNDPIWLFLDGEVKLALGWYDNARADFTRVLAARPDLVEAYLGRGLADAHLGRLARYDADLAAAGELNQDRAKAFKAEHAKEVAALQSAMPTQTPQELAANMVKKSMANDPMPELVATAKALELATNATRRYGDEQYQDGLRKLQNQVIADPKSSVRWGELAKYVYLEARVRTVWNGRGNKLQDLRNQDHDQYLRERQLAMQYADKALSLDPKNVDALGTKGWLTLMDGDTNAALQIAEKGLELQAYYPRLAKLKSTCLAIQADNEWYEAQKLKAPRNFNGPGWWLTVYPSQAELQQARQYEQMSSQTIAQAGEQQRVAYEKYSASLLGMLLKGDYYAWVGDFPTSIAAYEQVLKIEPENVQALEALFDTYTSSVQDAGKALFYEVKYVNTQQTTAAPWLNVAWELIVQTRWRSAEQALDQAMLLDPADTRIFAYRAVVAMNQDKPADAAAYWRVVLAMEEARMNLDGQTLLSSQSPQTPLTRQNANMALQALGNLARINAAQGRQQDAQANQAMLKAIMGRVTLVSLRTDLPFTSLPVPGNEAAGDPGPFGKTYQTPDRGQSVR